MELDSSPIKSTHENYMKFRQNNIEKQDNFTKRKKQHILVR